MATVKIEKKSDRYGNRLTQVSRGTGGGRVHRTYISETAKQPSVQNTQPSIVRTRGKPTTGRTIPMRQSGRVVSVARKTIAGRAANIALKAKGKVHLPHADKRTQGIFGKATSHSPVLLAEFLVGLLLIGMGGVSGIARDGYQKEISNVMLKYTAFTAVFFVLFLLSSGKRGSQFAAWFGGLIDLGILFNVVNRGSVADLTSMVKGQGLGLDSTTLVDSLKPDEFYNTGTTSDKPE